MQASIGKIQIAKIELNLQDAPVKGYPSIVLYAQGCHWHCDGCHSKELWDFRGGQEFGVEDLMDWIRFYKLQPTDVWLVGVGGDFYFQKENWRKFLKEARARSFDKIAWHTGASVDELVEDGLYTWLDLVDIIYAGRPFHREAIPKVYLAKHLLEELRL